MCADMIAPETKNASGSADLYVDNGKHVKSIKWSKRAGWMMRCAALLRAMQDNDDEAKDKLVANYSEHAGMKELIQKVRNQLDDMPDFLD